MKKTSKILSILLLLLHLKTAAKVQTAAVRVDKCGCNADIFNLDYYYTVVESKGYYEFLKDQIHYFHRKWVHTLINSTNSDKLYHVFVQSLKSRPLYTTVNDQKIKIDKEQDYFFRYEKLLGIKKEFLDKLRIYEQNADPDMIGLVNDYFNDSLAMKDNFKILITKLNEQNPGAFTKTFIYHYGKFVVDQLQIETVNDVFVISKKMITKEDAYLLLNLGVYLHMQDDIVTQKFVQTQKWGFDALAYEVEVELKDNQRLLKKKFYLIYQLHFIKGGSNVLQFKAKAYYLDSTKTSIGIDDISKEAISQANFLRKDMKERKDLFKKFPVELKFVQAYKYPGPPELQTSCIFAGASLRVAISFIISSLMRDNFGTYYYCGERSLMFDFDINQWGRDGKEWLNNFSKLKPNRNPYSPEENLKPIKQKTPTPTVEELDDKTEKPKSGEKPISGEKPKSGEKKVVSEEEQIHSKSRTKTPTSSSEEIPDEFDPEIEKEKKKKKTTLENPEQKNEENPEQKIPSKTKSSEEEIPLTKLILPNLKPPFEAQEDPDFSEIIQLPVDEEPITKETVLPYNCETFLNSINGEAYLYPENLSGNIFFIRNLSFLSLRCEDEISENGDSSGSIYLYDSPILKLIFTSNETRYCFEIDGDTVLYNSTYFVCFNKLKDGEIDFVMKKSDPLLFLYKRTYSPVLEAVYQTLLTLNDMKKSFIVAGDVWDYLFAPFFMELNFEEFRGDLLKGVGAFRLSFSQQTKSVERNMINEKGFIYWLSFEQFSEMKILVRIINANEDFMKLSINIGEKYFELFIPKMFYLNHEESEIVKNHSPVISKEEFYLQNNYFGLIGKFFASFVESEIKIPEITEKGGYSFDLEKYMPEYLKNYFKVNYSDFTLLFTSMSYMLSNMTFGEDQKLYDIYVGNVNDNLLEFLNTTENNSEMIKKFEDFFYCERTTNLEFSELPKDEDSEEEAAEKEPKFSPRKITEFSNFVNVLIESDQHEKWIYITEESEKKNFHELEGILKNDKIGLTQKLSNEEDNKLQNNFLEKLYYYLRTKSDTVGQNKFTLLLGNRQIRRFMLFEAWGYEMNHIKVFHLNLFSLYFNTQFIIQNSSFSFDFERLFELITMTSNHFKDIVKSMEDPEMHTFDFSVEKIKIEIDKLIEGKNICYYEVVNPDQEKVEVQEGEEEEEKDLLTYFIAKSHVKEQNCDLNEENLAKDFKLAIVVRKKDFKNNRAGYVMKVFDNKVKEGSKNVLSTEYEFYRHSQYNFKPIFRNYVKGVIEHFVTGKFDFGVTPPLGQKSVERA